MKKHSFIIAAAAMAAAAKTTFFLNSKEYLAIKIPTSNR